MLHKDRILSISSEFSDKLGFPSSRAADLYMLGSGLGKQAQDYLLNKVGEVVTLTTTDKLFGFSEQYDWQIATEPEAISVFAENQSTGQYIIHFPVISDGSIFIAEPSAVWVRGINQKNADEYMVEPIICKCPREFSRFINMADLNSPNQLKAAHPKYYWRLLDNMLVCNAMTAYFFVYHPLFDDGTNHHTIKFDRLSVLADLNELKQRKAEAARIYAAALAKIANKS